MAISNILNIFSAEKNAVELTPEKQFDAWHGQFISKKKRRASENSDHWIYIKPVNRLLWLGWTRFNK